MYLQNKYTNQYNRLISAAQARLLPTDVYVEKHHIVPRSLGGSNKHTNIVKLTPREHFICHLLLTKMTIGNDLFKMKHALNMLMNAKKIGKGRYAPTSRIYQYVKQCHSDAIREGWTEEKRKAHSETLVKFNSTVNKHSPEYQLRNKKISEFQKSKVWTEKAIQTRLKNCISNAIARKGKPWTDNMRQSRLTAYVQKNLGIALQVIELHDAGLNNSQISRKLEISWDKVKFLLLHRKDFEEPRA